MTSSQEQYEKIEAYLQGELSEQETKNFEQQLTQDNDLRETLDIHQSMGSFLTASPKGKLRGNLQQIRHEFGDTGQPISAPQPNGKKSWIWLLLVPFLGLVVWWINSEASQVTATSVVEESVESPSPSEMAPPPPTNEPVETTPLNKPVDNPSITPPSRTEPAPSPPVNLPIAASYEPNVQLENEIGTFLRGDFQMDIPESFTEQRLTLRNGSVNFALEASLKTDLIPGDDFELVLELYSNYPPDYRSGKTIVRQVLVPNNDSAPWQYTANIPLSVKAGLYYFLLKDDYSGVTLNGGKILLTAPK